MADDRGRGRLERGGGQEATGPLSPAPGFSHRPRASTEVLRCVPSTVASGASNRHPSPKGLLMARDSFERSVPNFILPGTQPPDAWERRTTTSAWPGPSPQGGRWLGRRRAAWPQKADHTRALPRLGAPEQGGGSNVLTTDRKESSSKNLAQITAHAAAAAARRGQGKALQPDGPRWRAGEGAALGCWCSRPALQSVHFLSTKGFAPCAADPACPPSGTPPGSLPGLGSLSVPLLAQAQCERRD